MIIYGLVARGTLVLAEYTTHDGDFTEIAKKILLKSPRSRDKKSYSKGEYLFSFFSEGDITFLCMSPIDGGKLIPFKYLEDVSEMWRQEVGTDNSNSAQFTTTIKELVERYSNKCEVDKLEKAEQDLQKVTEVVTDSLNKAIQRGSKLEDLMDKTSNLNREAQNFRFQSKRLASKLWKERLRVYMLYFFIAMSIVVVLSQITCNGFTPAACFSQKSWNDLGPHMFPQELFL